jgi:hypothetical protein
MANGYEQTLKNCCQKHDVTGIQCMISFEEKMPDLGMVPMMDAETGAIELINMGLKQFVLVMKTLP